MKYSINVKYWHDGHDYELLFHHKWDAVRVFETLTSAALNSSNDIEFVSIWDEENNRLLECIHF